MCLTLIPLCPGTYQPLHPSLAPLSLDLTTNQFSMSVRRADAKHQEHQSAPGMAFAQSKRGSDVKPFHWDSWRRWCTCW